MQADPMDTESAAEQALIERLRADPDFFVRHPALLGELNLPHPSGRAVSLVEHQVSILRERNMDMRRRLHQLVEAARENDRIFAKTRSLTLALLEVESAPELNEVLATHLLVDFEADFVCCHFPGDAQSLDHIQYHAAELPTRHLLPTSTPNCVTLRKQELEQIFPISEHAESGSAVILPVTVAAQRIGALCIGSRDPGHFTPDMDTLFVTYIADVLGKVAMRLGV